MSPVTAPLRISTRFATAEIFGKRTAAAKGNLQPHIGEPGRQRRYLAMQIRVGDEMGAAPLVLIGPANELAPSVAVRIAGATDYFECSADPRLHLLRANRSDQSIRSHLEMAEGPILRRIDLRLSVSAVTRRRVFVL